MIDALMLSVLTQLLITNFRIFLTRNLFSIFFKRDLLKSIYPTLKKGTKKRLLTGDVSFFIALGIKSARTKVCALWIQRVCKATLTTILSGDVFSSEKFVEKVVRIELSIHFQ